MFSPIIHCVAVLLLFVSRKSYAAHSRFKNTTIFDIAIVVNVPTVAENGFLKSMTALQSMPVGLKVETAGLDVLGNFIYHFMDSLATTSGDGDDRSRAAIVKSYMAKGPARKLDVIWPLEREYDKNSVFAALKNLTLGTTPAEYPTKSLGEDVKKEVFNRGGDQPYVPNLIIVVAIGQNQDFQDPSKIGDRFPGISIRVLARDFSNDKSSVVVSSDFGSSYQTTLEFASQNLTRNLEAVKCLVLKNQTVCHYHDKQKGECKQEFSYKVIEESHPPGYCLSGSVFKNCSVKQCEDQCENNIYWSGCDCKSGMEVQKMNVSLHEARFCQLKQRRCHESEWEACPLSTSAIIGLSVAAVSLGLTIGASVLVIVPKLSALMEDRPKKYMKKKKRDDSDSQL